MKFRVAAMLGDIIESLFKRPMTEKYPFERHPAPERLRGKLTWNPEKCTGCCLCNKDCPSNAIELIVIDKKAKRFVMEYHADRCTYCAQCVQNCRLECIGMAHDQWESAALNRQDFVVNYGSEADVAHILATYGKPSADAAPANAPQ
jgi:formate hydrogenlyase subunit 6/NADH:ubiquinone oxidoreductase subunit I